MIEPSSREVAASLKPGRSAIVRSKSLLQPPTSLLTLEIRFQGAWGGSMQQSDSTNKSTTSTTDLECDNVVRFSRTAKAQRFYDVQEQDVFQQNLEKLMGQVAAQRDLNADLFDFLTELRRRFF